MALPLSMFIAQYNNRYEAYPGDNAGYQCVDLAQFWAANFGYPRFTGNAINIYNEAGGDYEQIANTPSGVPNPGDLVVWGENAEAGTGAAGHVGIFVSGNATTLTVFNQNAPVGTPCHVQAWKNYAGIVGWLRPKALVSAPPVVTAGTATVLRNCDVRVAPNTSAALGGSQHLTTSETFEYSAIVQGQTVTENGVTSASWAHSDVGNYVWCGNLKLS
jgi:hypothetical protein